MRLSRSRRPLVALALAFTLVALAASPSARAEPRAVVFPLRVHRWDGVDVRQDTWLASQVARANARFARFGVQFEVHERVAIDPSHLVIETRRELEEMEPLIDRRQIDVFLVRHVVREYPDIIGICVPARGGGHYVALEIGEQDQVLAHELGHYFGLVHTEVRGNLMYRRAGSDQQMFDAAQGTAIETHARLFRDRHAPEPL